MVAKDERLRTKNSYSADPFPDGEGVLEGNTPPLASPRPLGASSPQPWTRVAATV